MEESGKTLAAKPSGSQKYSRSIAIIETCLIIAGLLGIWFLLPHKTAADGLARFENLSGLLQNHIIFDPGSRFSLIGPIFSTPLWLLGKASGSTYNWTMMYNPLIFILTLLFTYLLLKDRVDHSLLRQFFLILITSSMFAAHLTDYYGEVFTALCVGFGAFALFIRYTSWGGWIIIALGAANTPAALGGLVVFALKYVWDRRRLRYFLIVVAAGLLVLVEAQIRRGNPLSSGYTQDAGFATIMPYSGKPNFSYPFFFGLLSILFSFGKGLIFFAPGLLLPIRSTLLTIQRERKYPLYQVYLLWISFLIGLILVYARWWAWYGGIYWGPRFFLIASIPASFALAVRLRYRSASLLINLFTLLVLGLSAWVGMDGAIWIYRVTSLSTCTANNFALEALCHYTPEFSVLWHPFVERPRLHLETNQYLFLTYCLLVFFFLATPLILKIGQQLLALYVEHGKPYLNIKEWRF